MNGAWEEVQQRERVVDQRALAVTQYELAVTQYELALTWQELALTRQELADVRRGGDMAMQAVVLAREPEPQCDVPPEVSPIEEVEGPSDGAPGTGVAQTGWVCGGLSVCLLLWWFVWLDCGCVGWGRGVSFQGMLRVIYLHDISVTGRAGAAARSPRQRRAGPREAPARPAAAAQVAGLATARRMRGKAPAAAQRRRRRRRRDGGERRSEYVCCL